MRAEIHSKLHRSKLRLRPFHRYIFFHFPFSSTVICSPRKQDGLDNWYGPNQQKPQKLISAESAYHKANSASIKKKDGNVADMKEQASMAGLT